MNILLLFLPLSGIASLGVGLVCILRLAVKNRDNIITHQASTTRDYIPIVYVTAAAIIVYYIFLLYQSAAVHMEFRRARQAFCDKKIKEKPSYTKIKYGLDNFNNLAANRCAGNFLEQLIPFLVSLYLYATFVSVNGAVKFGWAWLFFRSYYLYVFKRGLPVLLLSTLPAYSCIWGMIGGTIYEVSQNGM